MAGEDRFTPLLTTLHALLHGGAQSAFHAAPLSRGVTSSIGGLLRVGG